MISFIYQIAFQNLQRMGEVQCTSDVGWKGKIIMIIIEIGLKIGKYDMSKA